MRTKSVQYGGLRCDRGFTHGQRCKVFESYLPNKADLIAKYKQKVFCGTYSTCGDLFMSACQGN